MPTFAFLSRRCDRRDCFVDRSRRASSFAGWFWACVACLSDLSPCFDLSGVLGDRLAAFFFAALLISPVRVAILTFFDGDCGAMGDRSGGCAAMRKLDLGS